MPFELEASWNSVSTSLAVFSRIRVFFASFEFEVLRSAFGRCDFQAEVIGLSVRIAKRPMTRDE